MKNIFVALSILVSVGVQAEYYDSTELTKQIKECAKLESIESIEQFKQVTSLFDEELPKLQKAAYSFGPIVNMPKEEDMLKCNEVLSKYLEVLKNGN